jgi:hypothetical protein
MAARSYNGEKRKRKDCAYIIVIHYKTPKCNWKWME